MGLKVGQTEKKSIKKKSINFLDLPRYSIDWSIYLKFIHSSNPSGPITSEEMFRQHQITENQ